jgi:hypothetical protein
VFHNCRRCYLCYANVRFGPHSVGMFIVVVLVVTVSVGSWQPSKHCVSLYLGYHTISQSIVMQVMTTPQLGAILLTVTLAPAVVLCLTATVRGWIWRAGLTALAIPAPSMPRMAGAVRRNINIATWTTP